MSVNLSEINEQNFEQKALDIFQTQFANNPIYRDFSQSIQKKRVAQISEIPFLPISFFKTHKVSCFPHLEMNFFESSGTSGQINSKHYIKDIEKYHESIEQGYTYFFKNKKYTIVGLLPHYLERSNSSLVYMVRHWMQVNQQEDYFFLHDLDGLFVKLNQLIQEDKNILLIGISFALLDFAELFSIQNSNLNIIETGGMKGSRPEILKSELVDRLQLSFPNSKIISEYGMCELFSQAYSDENLWFTCPPWMKVYISELNDPMTLLRQGSGIAKIIDLANIDSCSFIETQDLIQLREDGTFQILGRVDDSDIRGCSLMYNT